MTDLREEGQSQGGGPEPLGSDCCSSPKQVHSYKRQAPLGTHCDWKRFWSAPNPRLFFLIERPRGDWTTFCRTLLVAALGLAG